MSCPSTCTDISVIGNPSSNCTTDYRLLIPSRIFFFPCTVDLPDPIQGNIKPLFDDGTIAWSSELRDFVLDDPSTQDLNIADCVAPLPLITGRQVTFNDAIAVTYGASSPAETNTFWDYNFWNDKLTKQLQLRTMIAYCNGDVRIPVDANGVPLSMTMTGWVNYDPAGTIGGNRLEFKRIIMRYPDDPLNFSVTTAFNLTDEGISL